jgi:pentafunctional AROM polypeptide
MYIHTHIHTHTYTNTGTISMSATISSQYVSGILLAAPLARGPVALQLLEDKPISEPYIDMTVSMMKEFGVAVSKPAGNKYEIPNTGYVNPTVYEVEADASAATYPLAIAAITGGKVTCDAVGSGSTQGDAAFCFLLEKMGCTVTQDKEKTVVQVNVCVCVYVCVFIYVIRGFVSCWRRWGVL